MKECETVGAEAGELEHLMEAGIDQPQFMAPLFVIFVKF